MHTILQLEYLKGRYRPLGRTKDRWEVNIRMVLKIFECEVDCIHRGQDRDPTQAHDHSIVPPVSTNGEIFLDNLISRKILLHGVKMLSPTYKFHKLSS